jgi:hypothetical protein
MHQKTWFDCDPVALAVLLLSIGVVWFAFNMS